MLQDRHLTEASLKASAQKRQQPGGVAKNPSPAPAASNAPAPVYPDHAAFQAISRFAIRPPYPEFMVSLSQILCLNTEIGSTV